MWVVKLGGSLKKAGLLDAVFIVLGKHGNKRLVVVPGGGSFADHVRQRQQQDGFSDYTAHNMALSAMDQYGLLLAEHNNRLQPFQHPQQLTDMDDPAIIPIWLPACHLYNHPDIPANWQVTADSLALWLAQQIAAQALLLIKSAAPPANTVTELVKTGYLDSYFADLYGTSDLPVTCISGREPAALQSLLQSGEIRPAEYQECP